MQVWNVLHAAWWKYKTQNSPKICHLGTITQVCRAVSSQLRHVSTVGKKLVKQQYLLHTSSQYGQLLDRRTVFLDLNVRYWVGSMLLTRCNCFWNTHIAKRVSCTAVSWDYLLICSNSECTSSCPSRHTPQHWKAEGRQSAEGVMARHFHYLANLLTHVQVVLTIQCSVGVNLLVIRRLRNRCSEL